MRLNLIWIIERSDKFTYSLADQVTYIKKLDATAKINARDIANLADIVKNNAIQFHDRFQQVTRDIMLLNVTIHNQSNV
jgi:hypothetical protein